jgi:uncharacterized protein with HEPN domain
MGKFNLSEAAKEILGANVAAKQSGQESGVGDTKLSTSVAYGQKDAGKIGDSPTKLDDELPDYLKGTPTATPPGATPPVGSEPAKHLSGQPQQTQGRSDLTHVAQQDANQYDSIRDRVASKLAPQTMQSNPGATFQSYHEDIEAMLSGENLSEDFKSKASMIFESAVLAKATHVAEEVIAEAMDTIEEEFNEAVEAIKTELEEKVDGYLNYMVKEWAQENELAIVKGLRAEIVEDFIDGLRNLFIEHYIDIPEDKVDIVEELTAKIEELEGSLNEQIKESVQLTSELNEHKKFEAIYAACEGLTQTQVEKIKSLAESIEFTSDDEFADKLETIKESYIGSSVKTAGNSALDDEVQIIEEETKGGYVDPEIAAYSKTISKTLIK